jgi:hypothetical protein
MTDSDVRERGGTLALINLVLAGLLVLGAAGWSLIQSGCHSYYQREAKAFFQMIEQEELRYRNKQSKLLPFQVKDSLTALKQLNINPKEARYFDFSVEQQGDQGFRIIAYLKPDILRKWYLHNPKSEFHLVYEKKEGQKGVLIN